MLRLADLEQSKNAVLHSLGAAPRIDVLPWTTTSLLATINLPPRIAAEANTQQYERKHNSAFHNPAAPKPEFPS
jgi:hypothetical protein